MLDKLLELYRGTCIEAPIARGMKACFANSVPDCDCTDCDGSGDCSNCDAPGTTH